MFNTLNYLCLFRTLPNNFKSNYLCVYLREIWIRISNIVDKMLIDKYKYICRTIEFEIFLKLITFAPEASAPVYIKCKYSENKVYLLFAFDIFPFTFVAFWVLVTHTCAAMIHSYLVLYAGLTLLSMP